MKYEDVIKMLDAGYTRDEILEMASDEGKQDPAGKADEGKQDPAGKVDEGKQDPAGKADEGKEDPAGKADEGNGYDELKKAVSEVKEIITSFSKEMTAFNIMNSHQSPDKDNSVDDIIGNIISPKIEKK